MSHIEILMKGANFSFFWTCTVTHPICVCSDIEIMTRGCLSEVKNKRQIQITSVESGRVVIGESLPTDLDSSDLTESHMEVRLYSPFPAHVIKPCIFIKSYLHCIFICLYLPAAGGGWGGGRDSDMKMAGVLIVTFRVKICRLVPLGVLKSKMTMVTITALPFSVLSHKI